MNDSSRPLNYLVLVLMLIFFVACSSDMETVTVVAIRPSLTPPPPDVPATNTPTHTATPVPTNAPTLTPTQTPVPTETIVPTTTPFPTVTAMPTISTKTVFLEYNSTGGDGGDPTDLYYGRSMPYIVIYTDGQAIIGEFDEDGTHYFLEAWVSSDEMCHLLGQLKDTGFFAAHDPIYTFDETTQDGAGYEIMIANGPLVQRWVFYGPYEDYLIPPLKQSYELFKNYHPDGATYYIPERLILWVEEDVDASAESANVIPWPETLPPISELWQDPLNHEVLIEGEAVAAIMALFDYRLTSKRFVDEGIHYEIILRPLLPNENPYPDLWYYGTHSQTFNLPFDCSNLELPVIEPTVMATPVENNLVPDLTGKGRLLFSSNQSGNDDVYMINADGTNMLNLTNHLAEDWGAVLSPDGQHIAFVSDRDGNDEIYLMNPDGTHVTRLTHSADRDISPTWSPDGRQIIFMSDRLGNWENTNWQLFVIDIETGIEAQFSDEIIAGGMYAPEWSPDGNHILFSSGKPGALQIFTRNEDGESEELLGTGTGAIWSPDGRYIAFLDKGATDRYQIFLMNADGKNRRKLTQFDSYLSGMAWSLDGKYLAFTSSVSGKSFIFVLNVEDDGEPVLLVRNAAVSDWVP